MEKDTEQEQVQTDILDIVDANLQALAAQAQIFWLELKLAGHSFVLCFGLLLVTGLVAITTWIGLLVTIFLSCLHFGMPMMGASMLTLLFQIFIILGASFSFKKLAQNLKFNETVRMLQGKADAE